MADIRINALATTAASTASDDFLAVDGSANGTRKLNAYSPTFGGNLTVSGTGTVNSGLASGSTLFTTYISTDRAINFRNLGSGSDIWASNNARNAYSALSLNATTLALNADSGGNVLVGTTTDGGQKLQVNGTAAITTSTSDAGISLLNGSVSSNLLVRASRDGGSDAGAVLIYNGGTATTILKGTGASTIGGNLTVSGGTATLGSDASLVRQGNGWVQIANTSGSFAFGGYSVTTNKTDNYVGLRAINNTGGTSVCDFGAGSTATGDGLQNYGYIFSGAGLNGIRLFTNGSTTAKLTIDNAGLTTLAGNLTVSGTQNVLGLPASASALGTNSTMTFELTSNTSLTIKVRGTDGTTRSVALTLA